MPADEAPSASADAILFVQLNDLYHIDTSADYRDPDSLILPRIATFVEDLRKSFEGLGQVKFCVPGDFLAPSCLSKEFHGEQMVDILKQIGVNYVSFGNHEFEPRVIEAEHLERWILESPFTWLNTNFRFRDKVLRDRLERRMTEVEVFNVSPSHSVIMFGILNADTPRHLGTIQDHTAAAEFVIGIARELREEHQASEPERGWNYSMVAMTHQELAHDLAMASSCPELALIMGGHDHDVERAGSQGRCLIVKTASNARTLRLNWIAVVDRRQPGGDRLPDPRTQPARFKAFAGEMLRVLTMPVRHALERHAAADRSVVATILAKSMGNVQIDGSNGMRIHHRVDGDNLVFTMSIALDTQSPEFAKLVPAKAEVVDSIRSWNARSRHGERVLWTAPQRLEILDKSVRRFSTNFGNLVADIVRGIPGLSGDARPWDADVGLVNGGSFRIDRDLLPGEPVTGRTLCTIFGHENSIACHVLSGRNLLGVLRRALWLRNSAGSASEGAGNFLQLSGLQVVVDAKGHKKAFLLRLLGGREEIDPAKEYRVATTGYVAGCKDFRRFFSTPGESATHRNIEEHVGHVLESTDPALLSLMCDAAPRWVFAATTRPPG